MSAAAATIEPVAAASAPARVDADRAERDRRRAEAERWLASLPSLTTLRRRSREHPAPRLVMFKTSASSPRYWESLWLVSPSYRMRGHKLPAWYRAVFTRWLPSDGLIVEAGCGNGNLVRMLVNEDPARWGNFAQEPGRGACVEGLDFAERAVAENQRIHPEGRYRVGDVRALPYRDGELSGYLSMGVVEHFDEQQRRQILAEAARCLRPGGVAIFTVPFFSPLRRLRALLGGYRPESSVLPNDPAPDAEQQPEFYQFFFTRREIVRQVQQAGLKVVATDAYDARHGTVTTIGGGRILGAIDKRSARLARFIEQPCRPLRLFAGHMVLMVAVKP